MQKRNTNKLDGPSKFNNNKSRNNINENNLGANGQNNNNRNRNSNAKSQSACTEANRSISSNNHYSALATTDTEAGVAAITSSTA